MPEVLCWCCEHFLWCDEAHNMGICKLTNLQKSVYSTVCEDFLIFSGLYTKRTIPDFCKNYQSKKK